MFDLEHLRSLVESGDPSNRAFVDAMVRIGWSRTNDPGKRVELQDLHREVREASRRGHGPLRDAISRGRLRGPALRKHFDDVPVSHRDHFVEEVLGIAYPPLDEPELAPDLMAYAPSGYDEITHALDVTQLGPRDRFLDIGAGTGKAVILASMLTGATSVGIEIDASLHEVARDAAAELGLEEADLRHGDARHTAIEDADVVFMYLPFTGRALSTVMARLMDGGRRSPTRARGRFLCAGPVDVRRYVDLVPAGSPKSWLHVYAWR